VKAASRPTPVHGDDVGMGSEILLVPMASAHIAKAEINLSSFATEPKCLVPSVSDVPLPGGTELQHAELARQKVATQQTDDSLALKVSKAFIA